eukprot:11182100-Ditylum_brightwellii.AAC.1
MSCSGHNAASVLVKDASKKNIIKLAQFVSVNQQGQENTGVFCKLVNIRDVTPQKVKVSSVPYELGGKLISMKTIN